MMILPILTYRSSVKLSFTNTQKQKFTSLENRACRIIKKTVPSVSATINREACCLVRKCMNNIVCSNFDNYFVINEHSKKTRNSGYLLKVPKMKLELGKSTFKYAGTKLYNDLPLEIRKIEAFTTFKKEIKRFSF